MQTTPEFGTGRSLEGADPLAPTGYVSAESLPASGPAITYSHGYVDPWNDVAVPRGGFDLVLAGWCHAVQPREIDDLDESGDFDHDVLHGGEAGEWAPVGRRAFLKRINDD